MSHRLPENVVDDPGLRNRTHVFADRRNAGIALSGMMVGFVKRDSVVAAIPSGGIPVAIEISRGTGSTLRLMPVRKLVIPFEPEAGFGAISMDGEVVLNERLVASIHLGKRDIEQAVDYARTELGKRVRRFGILGQPSHLGGKAIILVDDGLASGYTMLAGIRSARRQGAGHVAVVVPTGSLRAVEMVAPEADRICCANIRSGFAFAVADAYVRWHDLSEDEAARMLRDYIEGSSVGRGGLARKP